MANASTIVRGRRMSEPTAASNTASPAFISK